MHVNVESSVLWPIIDFIYTGECVLDDSNVELFFQEGNNLGVNCIIECFTLFNTIKW